MHYQNLADLERHYQEIESNEKLPLGRGFVPTTHQRLIRELILLLKRGYLDVSYFKEKFDVDITEVFSEQWAALKEDGDAVVQGNSIELTQQGLLRVDGLLNAFFEPQFRGSVHVSEQSKQKRQRSKRMGRSAL